jgi:hypothetical protein
VQLPCAGHSSRHLLTSELAQTLACSLILSRIDYCNALLHGAPTGSIQKLQRVQNNAARVVLQASRRSHATPLLRQLLATGRATNLLQDGCRGLLTFNIRQTSTSVDTSPHATSRAICARPSRGCCLNRTATLLSPSAHSDALHQQFGTLCQRRLLTVPH